jgi:hypothetical protein
LSLPLLIKESIMEQESTSVWKSTLVSGVYLGIALILLSVVLYVTGNPFSKMAQYLSYPIMIAGIIFGQIVYKKELGGTSTYGQAFGAGLLTMVFASVLSGIYTYVLYELIDPSLQEQLRLFTEEQIVSQGKVPEEQIDMAIKIASKFQKPAIMSVMAVFGGAIAGTIISLITSIFVKKNPSDEVPE